ncbi:MAG: hypothetical protein KGI79_01220 [Patescibacteria group bacterium]|nr:hypothetical protein [Patescibacteria group bacterium]MDE2116478.1 hypothetical protein [Patescibacteria group bacterium]
MIKYIILAIILIIILSFFGYDLRAIIQAPLTQSNLGYAWSGVTYVWDNVLSTPINYFYHNIFLGILWQAFLTNLGRINAGAPTEIQNAGSRLVNIGNQGYQPIGQGQ